MHQDDYEVLKVFNNNVVLARHNGIEKILLKKGIGFGKNQGSFIASDTGFEKVFIIQNSDTKNRFSQLITKVDDEVVGLCEEVISMISDEIGQQLDDEIHVRLTDHIAFSLYRIKNNDEICNPFLIEISTLYPQEMNVAMKVVSMIRENTGVEMPDDEAGFIALHIHTARCRGSLSNTIKYTFLINTIVEFIEDELKITIDRKSIDYARFISHVRFALERTIKGIPLRNELLSVIKRKCSKSYNLAKKVSKIIEDELNLKVTPEETGYLAMHIERLKYAAEFKDKNSENF